MYWKYAGNMNNSPALAGYEAGTAVEIPMVFVNDGTSSLEKAYCYVSSEFFGMLEVKLASEGTYAYREVGGLLNGIGFLGTLPVGETAIDFRFTNRDDSTIKFFRVPISISYDDGATSTISFLWDYKDLLDYVYPGDESFAWIHPDDSGWTDDWRLWCTCYSNHHAWRTRYGLTYVECDCYPCNNDSFLDTAVPGYWQTSGSPWL